MKLTLLRKKGRFLNEQTGQIYNVWKGRWMSRGTDHLFYLYRGKRQFISDREFYEHHKQISEI